MDITGIEELDHLIGSIPNHWVTEFYGETRITSIVLHYTLAYQSRFNDVLYLHFSEFGGLDPFLVQSFSRLLGGDPYRVMVIRGFRFGDVLESLEEISDNIYPVIIIGFPYSFSPRGLSGYVAMNRVTGLIRRLSYSSRVILFNNTSRRGVYLPEGGNYHHHTVQVIVRLEKARRKPWTGLARLVKHPSIPSGAKTLFKVIGVDESWGIQPPLSVWL